MFKPNDYDKEKFADFCQAFPEFKEYTLLERDDFAAEDTYACWSWWLKEPNSETKILLYATQEEWTDQWSWFTTQNTACKAHEYYRQPGCICERKSSKRGGKCL